MKDLQAKSQRNRRLAGQRYEEQLRAMRYDLPSGLSPSIHGPVAYGYGRVSHSDSVKGDSLDAQELRISKFFDMKFLDEDIHWGGFYPESRHISAYSKTFLQRPTGKAILKLLRPGDHLLIDRIDRIWRNIGDYASLMEFFKREGINVHFVDQKGCSISMNTPMGDFFMTQMVAIAQLEAAMVSDRTLAGQAAKLEMGYWPYAHAPIGCKTVGKRPKRVLRWDYDQRATLAEVVRVIDEEGMSLDACSQYIESAHRAHNGLSRQIPKGAQRYWYKSRVRYGYVYEKHYQLVDDPAHLDFKKLKKLRFLHVKKNGPSVDNIRA